MFLWIAKPKSTFPAEMATFWLMVASVASFSVRDDDLDCFVRITAEDATHGKVCLSYARRFCTTARRLVFEEKFI